jgi:hypothetical protein
MTEAEAKKKWCPMVRITMMDLGVAVDNRGRFAKVTTNTHCIASECMMWWWNPPSATHINPAEEYHKTGYCGLGGKP